MPKAKQVNKPRKHIAKRPRRAKYTPSASSKRSCPPGQVLSKKSKRCVRRSHKVKITPLAPVKVPEPLVRLAEDCDYNKLWKEGRRLGRGAQGSVYTTCLFNDCEYAMKQVALSAPGALHDLKMEIGALFALESTGVVPKIHAAWTCGEFGYVVMDKVHKCVKRKEHLARAVKRALDKIWEKGWLHIDLKMDNIGCDANGKLLLIDFGYAVKAQRPNQKYPKHPLSLRFKRVFTLQELIFVQQLNYLLAFDPQSPQLPAYLQKWNQILRE